MSNTHKIKRAASAKAKACKSVINSWVNKGRLLNWYFAAAAVVFTSNQVSAQTNVFADLLPTVKAYQQKAVQEKIFLHLDRPAYASGDVMWFKVYNVDGTHHRPFNMSKVAYVEVLDSTRRPVLQGKIGLQDGMGNGSFVLPVNLESGTYLIRAYTNWMKNFSPGFYFEQPVTVLNTFKPVYLKAKNDTAAYAIQFFPEGGDLVGGIPARVAFKAVNTKTGKGAFCTGEVLNSAGKVVTTFEPAKLGIGSFNFTPEATDTYLAIVKYPGGKVIRQQLPTVKREGYSLRIEEGGPGQLKVTAFTTNQQPEQLYLLGHTRHQVVVAANAIMANGKASFNVSKDSLGAGITHFTLFNSQKQPLSERLFFKKPASQLDLELAVNKKSFTTREKVTVEIRTKHAATATPTNLSMAVFKTDGLQAVSLPDIKVYLWLSSDLQGPIEEAASYLSDSGPAAEQAVDNLMLTHGWSRFTWNNVLQQETLAFSHIPEVNGHLVQGKLTHKVSGQPAAGIRAYLSSPGKNVRFYSSVSNPSGNVLFEMKDFYGPKEVIMQTNFAQDSMYHFMLVNPFSEKYASTQVPIFDVSENLKEQVYARHLDVQAQNIYFENHLNKFSPPGLDSLPFYGKPSQQYLLDDYIRFKTMEEVMREYVPGVLVRKRKDGFHFMVLDEPHKRVFEENPLVLLDGVPIFDVDQIMAFDPLKVQKLDVMTNNYHYGSMVTQGVVSYTTYKGDLAGFPVDTRALMQEYEGLQLEREFYAPLYETEEQKQSRLPDWRNLLYWNPSLTTDTNGNATAQFYTADLAGTYTLVVQGLNVNGHPCSKVVSFEVRKPL
ncbi:MAG: hypothetical protein ACO1OQ_13325 [Rufibacter sp.]